MRDDGGRSGGAVDQAFKQPLQLGGGLVAVVFGEQKQTSPCASPTTPSCSIADASLSPAPPMKSATIRGCCKFWRRSCAEIFSVIASEAKQSRGPGKVLDCFVAALLAMTDRFEG
ncbi:hypothetical protein [Rhodopseudomonas palustris]|uniref:hypothetical protein n=1 Tax=Rhodopseudomonas palustris TaxID=1076 RepID=UPI0021F34AEB|nr:hypothetical protein [Rhodopseudomonas palustris]